MSDSKEHFMHLSAGKMQGLRCITDADGRFRVLALDQSNSFRKALRKTHEIRAVQGEPTYEEIRDAKLEFSSKIGKDASAVLLDVSYGLRQAINVGAIPKGVGLLGRVEASRDAGTPGELEHGWSVRQIKQLGADAVKLLVYLDMGDEQGTAHQMEFVQQIQHACNQEDILLLVEELSYPRPGEDPDAYSQRKVKNIIDSARALGPHCDILKLEFPGDIIKMSPAQIQDNLARVNEVAIRPWVLLSAGADFDIFEKQVELAMKAGSSGIMAGRAIFKEWFNQQSEAASERFIETTGIPRFQSLCKLVGSYATSWLDRYGITTADLENAVSPEWYLGGREAVAAAETSGEY